MTVYTSHIKQYKVWIIVDRHRIGCAMPFIPAVTWPGRRKFKNVDGIKIDLKQPYWLCLFYVIQFYDISVVQC